VIASLPQSVGQDAGAYLPMTATAFCDEQHRDEAAAFFKDRAAKAVGGPRMLAQALERVSLCIARRQAQEPEVAAFLRNY
jgi:alanyl aminopeptidase